MGPEHNRTSSHLVNQVMMPRVKMSNLTNRSDFTCGRKDMGPEHNRTSSHLVNQAMMPRV
jgi:hypothetical protein